MQDHLVSVSLAQPVRGISRLVCVHSPLGFIHIEEEITFFSAGGDLIPGCGALALVERTPDSKKCWFTFCMVSSGQVR